MNKRERNKLRVEHLRRTIKNRRQGINFGKIKIEGTKPIRYTTDPDGILDGDIVVPQYPLSLSYYNDKGEFIDCVQDPVYLKNLYKKLGTSLKKEGII